MIIFAKYLGRLQLKRAEKKYDSFIYLDDETSRQIGCDTSGLAMTELATTLECLTPLQKSRLVKYYILRKKQQEIADEENTSKTAIHYSIQQAKRRLKENGFTAI